MSNVSLPATVADRDGNPRRQCLASQRERCWRSSVGAGADRVAWGDVPQNTGLEPTIDGFEGTLPVEIRTCLEAGDDRQRTLAILSSLRNNLAASDNERFWRRLPHA